MQQPQHLSSSGCQPSALLDCAIDREPIAVTPDTPVVEVLVTMSQNRASYILILENEKLVGIFTERDVVKLTTTPMDLSEILIAQVMTCQLITLSLEEKGDIFSVLSLLRSARIRHLPLLDDRDRVVGVITPESLRQVLKPTDLLQIRRVGDVMVTQVVNASPSILMFELAQIMVEQRKSCVVICEKSNNGDRQIPIGIVTERDIVQFKAMGLDLFTTPAEAVMSTPLFPISVNASLWEANQMMQEHCIRRLVAVDLEGSLAGIVTQSTLLQALDPVELYSTVELLQQTVTKQTLELQKANEEMKREVSQRQEVQTQLEELGKNLKQQVDERTLELQKANGQLQEANLALERANREQANLNEELERRLKQLEKAQVQLVQSEKMSALGQLISGIGHEINNPVTFLKGNLKHAQAYIKDLLDHLELYRQELSDPSDKIKDHAEEIDLDFVRRDLPEIIDSMTAGVDRVSQLSVSLRTFSRSDATSKVPVDLHEGLQSTLVILKHRLKANENRPDIKVIEDYGELPNIPCYPGPMNQVFMNILANAIDAVEESNRGKSYDRVVANPNKIWIKTQWEGGDGDHPPRAIVSIKDNGMGMPESVREKIFDRLFTTKPVGKGTGLGLSISYQIVVEKHKGSLICLSEPGKGTEFQIVLPVRQKLSDW
ncbi:CBS domain-containing protein [Oxynema sp. CENA135]|uniref:CBS domain-containing protein n=1 Tax=Oxynema sp. CENA135 TaxID=984206 RepID=UPI00190A9895|nr:CBS domain-containing protein [Oxynema sp. CENA135]MBK4730584.1 CBS domain-containing protein [Oxynema sp. CENA135]